MRRKLLFVVNNPDFFLSHRLPLGLAARQEGFEVHVATPRKESVARIEALGFRFHEIALNRNRHWGFGEIATFKSLLALYRRIHPDIVHHVTIKPVLYGSLAALLSGVPRVVNAISGLGYVFIASGFKARLLRCGAVLFYRLVFWNRRCMAIFQNPDDRDVFLARSIVKESQFKIIRGSGVDLDLYAMSPEPPGTPVVLFPGRMLRDKGVYELLEAARLLKTRGIAARFLLAGDVDAGNPASLTAARLEAWNREGLIEWLGHRTDMVRLFQESHVVCLPSYREGLPKSLIEAAGCGKPIVTTDVPGCREVVDPGRSGYLVPVRDAEALARALETLLRDPELRREMGKRGREKAEREFSLPSVVRETLALY